MSRTTIRALSISVALHAAVLASLLALRIDLPFGAVPSPIRVHLEPQADARGPAADAESAAARAPEPLEPALDPAVAALGAGAARRRTVPPAPIRPPRPLPQPLEPVAPARTAVGVEPSAPMVAAEVEVVPAVLTADIEGAERAMLDASVERWGRRLHDAPPSMPSTWAHDGRTYTAAFAHVPAADVSGLDEVLVTVSTIESGNRFSTEIRMRRLAFSSFAQFVHRWDPAVQIHDDEIDGRFHSNSEIYVSNSRGVAPVFHGPVTTAHGVDTSYSDRRVRHDEVFLGGLRTRAGRIDLPRSAVPLTGPEALDEARVHRFEADTRITFHADGTYAARPLAGGPAEQRALPRDAPAYLIAGDGTALHVAGSVSGRALVYSADEIVIAGDLTYSRGTAGRDYVGLVSDGTVEIAEPEVTGPGDLHVHAAIYARRQFAVRRYGAREQATLHVLGSVTAGSLTATEPRYRTRLRFDPRLERRRPPAFPLTDRYEVAEWDRKWIVEPLAAAAGIHSGSSTTRQ